ncbi:MAG TPA: LysR family transcriptional regulator [Alicycliphilus sp.]|nr:LysR family transcriptional regulator [Alicycliphilus sp.]
MRLEDLEIFRAVHETGSFQRAAQRSGLSQSAVTKIVRKLEDEFGLTLIERGGRVVALTPAGRTLYHRTIELADLAAATRRDMVSEAAALRGSVRLGVVPALLHSVATPTLAETLASSKSVQIQLIVKHSAELVRLVEDGKLDLALCFGVQHVSPNVVCTLVGRQHYRLVVREGHPLLAGQPSLQELSRLGWLLPPPDVSLRAEIERMFSDAGLGPLNVRIESDASATLLAPLIRQGYLVGVLAEQALRPLSRDGLGALDVDLQALHGNVAIYYRRQAPSIGLVMDLRHRLEAQARSNLPG